MTYFHRFGYLEREDENDSSTDSFLEIVFCFINSKNLSRHFVTILVRGWQCHIPIWVMKHHKGLRWKTLSQRACNQKWQNDVTCIVFFFLNLPNIWYLGSKGFLMNFNTSFWSHYFKNKKMVAAKAWAVWNLINEE